MGNWWVIYQLSKMKQAEILKQAGTFYPAEESGPNRREACRGFRAFLNRLGESLVIWGLFLQKRYGPQTGEFPR